MPGKDGTGPLGAGSMTGRKMGFCASNAAAGFTDRFNGLGRGMGFGRNAGRCRGFGWSGFVNNFDVKEDQKSAGRVLTLEAEIETLKNRLEELEKR